MYCNNCNKLILKNETYRCRDKWMCEDCAILVGLHPLGHTGSRRDKISENGRRLTEFKSK